MALESRIFSCLFMVGILWAPGALAQTAAAAPATQGCFPGGPPKRPDAVSAFVAKPAELLTKHATGGVRLSGEVRDILGSDRAALGAMISAAKSASPTQVSAIGSGLGQAAVLCSKVDPQIALGIQQAVAASGLPDLLTAFVASSNPVETAAVNAAAGAPAAAGGALGGAVNLAAAAARTTAGQGSPASSAAPYTNGQTAFTFKGPSTSASGGGGTTVVVNNAISPGG
jgi:hypothetical protein